MKLKKIASLALAGVMAVSMLAGCADKAPETGNNGEGEGEVAQVTIADILNNGQDSDNKAKITFSTNSLLETALQAALAKDGLGVGKDALVTAAANAGVKATAVPKALDAVTNKGYEYYDQAGNMYDTVVTNFLTDAMQYYHTDDSANLKNLAGTYTYVNYQEFKGYADEAAALKAVAKYMDGIAAKLPTTSKKVSDTSKVWWEPGATALKAGGYYYSYTYTGNAVLVVLPNVDGTTTYGLFYAISQNVAKAQLA